MADIQLSVTKPEAVALTLALATVLAPTGSYVLSDGEYNLLADVHYRLVELLTEP